MSDSLAAVLRCIPVEMQDTSIPLSRSSCCCCCACGDVGKARSGLSVRRPASTPLWRAGCEPQSLARYLRSIVSIVSYQATLASDWRRRSCLLNDSSRGPCRAAEVGIRLVVTAIESGIVGVAGHATCGKLHWGRGFLSTCTKRCRGRSGTVRTKRNAFARRDGRWHATARNVRGRAAHACLHAGSTLADWRLSEGARSG